MSVELDIHRWTKRARGGGGSVLCRLSCAITASRDTGDVMYPMLLGAGKSVWFHLDSPVFVDFSPRTQGTRGQRTRTRYGEP